jgi:LysM repeat protein
VTRDKDNELPSYRRAPDEDVPDSEPSDASESDENPPRERSAVRPVTRFGSPQSQGTPLPFYRVPNGSSPRRGPSYPAWEKPPSPYDYPRLRGLEGPKPNVARWVLVITAIGAVLLILVVFLWPALTGRGKSAAVVSPSPTSVASQIVGSSHTPAASASSVGSAPIGSTQPQPSFAQYKVLSGDTITKIAKKYGLKTSELLLANPALAANPNSLKVGLILNIPQPGQLTPPPATPTPPAPSASPRAS